jgi:H+/Cl- antiporter ClcA
MRKERPKRFWQYFALSFILLAVFAAAAGSLLTTTWILNEQLHPWLHALGLVFLILAIPVLIAGGHCLDLRDRRR